MPIDPFWIWVGVICLFFWITDNKVVVLIIAAALALCYTTTDGRDALCRTSWQPRDFACPAPRPLAIDPASPGRTLGYVAEQLEKAGG